MGQTVRGLEVRSIAKAYDGRAVLHDVSLSVSRGEVVGLLGPNGAGKTTSFYSVMGLVKPDSGRIFLDNEDITGLPMYRRAILGLGYLPQETSIFRGLSVEQNILAVLEVVEPDVGARSARLDFSQEDQADDDELNDILWVAIRGTPPPAPVRSIFAK